MKHSQIPVTSKDEIFYAIVDVEDYPLLIRHKWILTSEGYARTCLGSQYIYMHKLVLPVSGSLYVDHINRIRLDNRKENLREATNSQNQLNRHNTGDPEHGVNWHTLSGKWRVRFTRNRKEIYLGLFEKKEDAVIAKDKWLRENS